MKSKISKSVLLVSLNSKRLDRFIQTGLASLGQIESDETDIYIFDVFEILNGVLFNQGDLKSESERLESITYSVYNRLFDSLSNKGKIIKYSESKKNIRLYMSAVYKEFLTNQSFERHLNSQIFQNLQPKLKRYGITNSKSPVLEIMTPFLLAEFAFYLYVFDTGCYDVIYGLEDEMGFIKSIKNGKYQNLMPFVRNETNYIKIDF